MPQGTQPRKSQPLPKAFYDRSQTIVARELLGMVLARRVGKRVLRGRIVETEAYGGRADRASHAHAGKTARNAVMFGPPGIAYVYFTYGMHWLLNVVCQDEGIPAAVLIRGIELLTGSRQEAVDSGDAKTTAHCPLPRVPLGFASRIRRDALPTVPVSGPARLTKQFRITGTLNGEDLVTSSRLWITRPTAPRPAARVLRTPRVGIAYAGAVWTKKPWRFLLATKVNARR